MLENLKRPKGLSEKWVPVKVRVVAEYVTYYPAGDPDAKENFEFNRNDGCWCSDNALREILEYKKACGHCSCSFTKFEYLGPYVERLAPSETASEGEGC